MVRIRAEAMTSKVRDRQKAILRAAADAFRERGFRESSMRGIAAKLGMTVGNLYYYFGSKQELLAYCQDATLCRLQAMADWAGALPHRAADRLFLLIVGHVVCLNEAIPGSLAHLAIESLEEPERSRFIARRDRYERALRDVVREGVDAGDFVPTDPKIAVLTILGALNASVLWFRSDGLESAHELGRRMGEHLVRGLLRSITDWRSPTFALPAFDEAALHD